MVLSRSSISFWSASICVGGDSVVVPELSSVVIVLLQRAVAARNCCARERPTRFPDTAWKCPSPRRTDHIYRVHRGAGLCPVGISDMASGGSRSMPLRPGGRATADLTVQLFREIGERGAPRAMLGIIPRDQAGS